jgi:SAM-dependent methyltransferase
MAWYREWFGEEYLELYPHRGATEAEDHAGFVASALAGGPAPGRVLDLACGTGRHADALRALGYRAYGTDLSLTLLAHSPRLPRAAGDMRSLPFASGAFDWVLNFFTSFGYFERERENFEVLEEMVRVLAVGGRFVIDLFNIDWVLANLEPRGEMECGDKRATIERWYDPAARRINKRIRLQTPGRPARTFLESVRAYRLDEVTSALAWAGLAVTDSYGDFRGSDFQRDSPRLILVGHKPG